MHVHCVFMRMLKTMVATIMIVYIGVITKVWHLINLASSKTSWY